LVFRRSFAILDVEPFGSPPLDRRGKRKFEVLRLRVDRDYGSAQFRFSGQSNIGAKPKNRPPEKKVGLNAQE
jgi:hypothetical protein